MHTDPHTLMVEHMPGTSQMPGKQRQAWSLAPLHLQLRDTGMKAPSSISLIRKTEEGIMGTGEGERQEAPM